MPPCSGDFTPHSFHLIYILIRRLIRGGIGTLQPFGPLLVEIESILGDIKLNKALTELNKALTELNARVEGIQQSVEDSAPAKQVIGGLREQDTPGERKSVELKGSVKGIISCLKHSSDPSADDLRTVIERCATLQSVSQGKLISKRKLYRREGAKIMIGELEIGKLFFPLNFLRQNLTTHAGGLRILNPFNALFEPEVWNGLPKWICVEFEDDQFVVRAYPKLIRLNSAGQVYQLDEVVVDPSTQFNSFEYWPNAEGSDKVKKVDFLVEMHFGKPFQLLFREKGKVDSPLLILTLSYDEE